MDVSDKRVLSSFLIYELKLPIYIQYTLSRYHLDKQISFTKLPSLIYICNEWYYQVICPRSARPSCLQVIEQSARSLFAKADTLLFLFLSFLLVASAVLCICVTNEGLFYVSEGHRISHSLATLSRSLVAVAIHPSTALLTDRNPYLSRQERKRYLYIGC